MAGLQQRMDGRRHQIIIQAANIIGSSPSSSSLAATCVVTPPHKACSKVVLLHCLRVFPRAVARLLVRSQTYQSPNGLQYHGSQS